MSKCYFDLASKFHRCETMEKISRKNGKHHLLVKEVFDMELKRIREIGIMFKDEFFNYCPFCGRMILNDNKQLNQKTIPK